MSRVKGIRQVGKKLMPVWVVLDDKGLRLEEVDNPQKQRKKKKKKKKKRKEKM